MLSIIPLPSNFVTEITGNASTILTDLAPYLTLIIGVILGVLIITALIDVLKR